MTKQSTTTNWKDIEHISSVGDSTTGRIIGRVVRQQTGVNERGLHFQSPNNYSRRVRETAWQEHARLLWECEKFVRNLGNNKRDKK